MLASRRKAFHAAAMLGVRAGGFAVTRADATGVQTEIENLTHLSIFLLGRNETGGNATFRLTMEFYHGRPTQSTTRDKAEALGEAYWQTVEDDFHRILDAFTDATRWEPVHTSGGALSAVP